MKKYVNCCKVNNQYEDFNLSWNSIEYAKSNMQKFKNLAKVVFPEAKIETFIAEFDADEYMSIINSDRKRELMIKYLSENYK